MIPPWWRSRAGTTISSKSCSVMTLRPSIGMPSLIQGLPRRPGRAPHSWDAPSGCPASWCRKWCPARREGWHPPLQGFPDACRFAAERVREHVGFLGVPGDQVGLFRINDGRQGVPPVPAFPGAQEAVFHAAEGSFPPFWPANSLPQSLMRRRLSVQRVLAAVSVA